MKTIYKLTLEYPTALFMTRQTFLVETPADRRAIVEAAAVAGVKVVEDLTDEIFTPADIVAAVGKERRIAAELAGNAFATAINPRLTAG